MFLAFTRVVKYIRRYEASCSLCGEQVKLGCYCTNIPWKHRLKLIYSRSWFFQNPLTALRETLFLLSALAIGPVLLYRESSVVALVGPAELDIHPGAGGLTSQELVDQQIVVPETRLQIKSTGACLE